MKNKGENIKQINRYIEDIISSNFTDDEILKKEYPGIIEHDENDLVIAKEIYKELKKKCKEYKEGFISSEEISSFCSNTMYSKYKPKIVSKIISEEIYDALDYISELDFNLKKSNS